MEPSARPRVPAELGVVVLAHGPARYEAVLEAVRGEGVPAGQVLVVHNPRAPREPDLAPSWPGVRVLRMGSNGGYAAGMNAGVRVAREEGAKLLLLLTHDVAVAPGAVLELLGAAERSGRPIICGPRLEWLGERGEVDRRAFGGWWAPDGRTGQHERPGPALSPPVDGLTACDWTDGSVMLIDAAVLDAIGPIDERFFLYFEETELCLRAGRAGFSVACAVDACFSQSTGVMRRPGAYGYLSVRNGLEFTNRLSGRSAVPAAALRLLRTLPVLRTLRPRTRTADRVAFAQWVVGGLLGALAYAAGRLGPPPPIVPGQGDIRGRRRVGGRLWAAVLALAGAILLGGCGESRQPPPPSVDTGKPLLGPRSAFARTCRLDPAVGEHARAAQRQRDLLLGLDVGLRFEDTRLGRCAVANAVQRAGASVVREDFDWGVIEPSPGRFDWGATDRVVAAAAARGLTVLPIARGRPGWAAETDDAAFGRFLGAAARRYGPGGSFFSGDRGPDGPTLTWWELLNEPYEKANPERVTAERYARLVRTAVPVARRSAPRARFLLSGEAEYQTPDGEFREDWMSDLFAAVPDLAVAFDGVAVHSYGRFPAPYDPEGGRGQSSRLERVHAFLDARGLGKRPIWVTEVGWTTCTGGGICVSPEGQRARLATFLRLARTRWQPYVRAVIVYQLREAPAGRRPDDPYRFYGLLDGSYHPKPAYSTFVREAEG